MNRTNIFEVNMSPSVLRAEASKAGARIGIEYEMTVPLPSKQINIDFFYQIPQSLDDFKRSINKLKNVVNDEETSNRLDKLLESVTRGIRDYVFDYVLNDVQDNEVAGFLEDNYELVDYDFRSAVSRAVDDVRLSRDLTSDELESIVKMINDGDVRPIPGVSQNEMIKVASAARHYRNDDMYNFINEVLSGKNKRAANEFIDYLINQYDAEYFSYQGDDFYTIIDNALIEVDPTSFKFGKFEDIVNDFIVSTGIRAVGFSKYHGGKSSQSAVYRIEPDSSVDEDPENGTRGLEFISPPLDLETTVKHFQKIRSWAIDYGCTTNKSTGLHMNVSVPNFEQLDYIKLVLLVGDKRTLEEFDRVGNTYAVLVTDMIAGRFLLADNATEKLKALKQQLVKNLHDAALHLIDEYFGGRITKYFSVRLDSSGYIEFRSPGGDWLNYPEEQIFNTIYRFVSALTIACDPSAYRNEYKKKFYNFVANMMPPSFGSQVFSSYAAGLMPAEEVQQKITTMLVNRVKNRITQVDAGRVGKQTTEYRVFLINSRPTSLFNRLATFEYVAWGTDKQAIAAKFPGKTITELSRELVGTAIYREFVNFVEELEWS